MLEIDYLSFGSLLIITFVAGMLYEVWANQFDYNTGKRKKK